MLRLTLGNGAVIEISENEDNAISNRDELSSVFSGTSFVAIDSDGDADVSNILFDMGEDFENYNVDEAYGVFSIGDHYRRIKSAEWCFAESGFERFVQAEMNRNDDGADVVNFAYNVIEHGCESGCVSSLIYTSDILKVLSEHARDIQAIVDDVYYNIGELGFLFKGGFTFDKLVWMCFEETVRRVLRGLGLEDV